MSVRVQCPSCGGPVVFTVGSSMVAVCPYCRSAVARGDRSIENLGKVADLVETGAVLRVGTEGRYEGRKFHLTGRTQLRHGAGGVWDEWYAAFDNGRWGWLAEAQGRYYLLFEQTFPSRRPNFEMLNPGETVDLPEAGERFVTAETGTATVNGAEGEIPYRLVPGSTYRYADLSSAGAGFATLDYQENPPALYIGREISLDELGVPNLRRETFELREVQAKRINCPKCGGPLELRAPDQTQRVGCPYCGSMLDATQGNLTLLRAKDKPPFEVQIPLGSKGTLGTAERTVIGAIERGVTVDGTEYRWQEYLLYHPRDGFEWLVCSDGHWTRTKGVPIGDVDESKSSVRFRRRTYQIFQVGTSTVRGVVGECYWKVAVGDTVETADFIRPPEILSREVSEADGTREINWSCGIYLRPEEVQKAFGLPAPLPTPRGIAPNQPFPYSMVYRFAALFCFLLCVLGVTMLIVSPSRQVYEQTFQLRPAIAVPNSPDKTQTFFTGLFELKDRRNVCITLTHPQIEGWFVAEGDLVQQSTGLVQPFFIPMSYTHGVEDGESWSEGELHKSEYLSAQPPGQYSIKLEVEREHPEKAGTLSVRVDQGAAQGTTWLLTLCGLLIVPAAVGVYHLMFNYQRWQNSDIPPSRQDKPATSDDDDD